MKRGENTAGGDTGRTFEIRVNGRRLVRTNQLTEAQEAARAAAQVGEGAEIVDTEPAAWPNGTRCLNKGPPQ